jgi:fumarate hydratase class I
MKEYIYELIRRTSSDLPRDIENKIIESINKEKDKRTEEILRQIIENVYLARKNSLPICQDTGSLLFFIKKPISLRDKEIIACIHEATKKATLDNLLRPNAVFAITGKNTNTNIGIGQPYIHIEEHESDEFDVKLVLKGGGSENVGAQYRLPDSSINAGRDITGVKKCIFDAVFQAQGKGCAPGILSVCVGGDRATSYMASKQQFLRKLDTINSDKTLANLEIEMTEKLNLLGIGPMGFGGNTTVLGIFIEMLTRHPASFFVSVSYTCWAYRRRSMKIKGSEVSYD